MTPPLIVDGFAGPGGWSEGLRALGLTDLGLELDTAACSTRAAAGHPTFRCDVTQYPTGPFAGRITGKIDSPPCQAWSRAGKRLGLIDQPLVHQAVADLAAGRDTRAQLKAACLDERSLLAAEPMRWHQALRPAWIVMEQVPDVLPLWRQYAQILRGWGYSVWCGELNAADYGVPQTRRRAILIASRVQAVTAPEPTHAQDDGRDLFGGHRAAWRTMADALGWGYRTRPAPTVTGGGAESGGAEPFSSTSRRAMKAAMDDPGHWAWSHPAPTVGGTVGHVAGKQTGGHLSLEPAEAAALQSFPDGYPFRGNKGQRSLQIGNAVPPLLAAHIVAAATGAALPVLEAAA